MRCDTWEVTSDVRISDVPFCTVLERVLPGRIGAYIYPSDAVVTFLDHNVTKKTDLDGVIAREKSKRVGVHHINHISVSSKQTEGGATDDVSDDDEDDFGEEEDGECDDAAQHIAWEDDYDAEWGDKSK